MKWKFSETKNEISWLGLVREEVLFDGFRDG